MAIYTTAKIDSGATNSNNDSSSIEIREIEYAKQEIGQVHNIVGARNKHEQARGDYQSIVQVSGPAAWNLEKRSEQPAEHRQDNGTDYDTTRQLPSLRYVNRITTDTMSSDKPVANADASGSDAAELAKVRLEQTPALHNSS